MKKISIAFLTVLAVDCALSLTRLECYKYTGIEQRSLKASYEHCAFNTYHEDRCNEKCVFNHQGATYDGVLTLQSFSDFIRPRLPPEICGIIEDVMAHGFHLTGSEALYPDSSCQDWNTMYRAWEFSLNHLADYACKQFPSSRRRYWGK
ncbi:unnamed protein product [Allacma fusca]|uniref:Uncharacterized protein n=1 Tax=Allacma fusca TaxID=39272 RepID=A0A8J2P876_9HEXA|nr:unnamed protein product [Allacma fusca]